MRRSPTSWPSPLPADRATAVNERAAWSRRAVRFLNTHGRWCDLCEARTVAGLIGRLAMIERRKVTADAIRKHQGPWRCTVGNGGCGGSAIRIGRTLVIFHLEEHLDVHHRRGRGAYMPVGQEFNVELMVLCCRCHDRITTQHRCIARNRRIVTKDAFGHDTQAYADIIAAVTASAHPRYLRRGVRRMLFGRPPT